MKFNHAVPGMLMQPGPPGALDRETYGENYNCFRLSPDPELPQFAPIAQNIVSLN
ncbi:MAG: hypothetical protein NTX48_16335 [Planctomycetales bacterium]|nr:hypothetical protein [Planctomycetales bacterium]